MNYYPKVQHVKQVDVCQICKKNIYQFIIIRYISLITFSVPNKNKFTLESNLKMFSIWKFL